MAVATGSSAAAREKPGTSIRAYSPEADTYVTASEPWRNFGDAKSLRADADPEATTYLRFRIGKLRGEITGVTLLLHSRAGTRASYQVRRVYENGWREGRLTYDNAPRLSLRYASSRPVQRGAWSAVDVSAFVTSNEDGERVSLAITTKSARGVVFASRESTRGPRLVVRSGDKDSKEDSPDS